MALTSEQATELAAAAEAAAADDRGEYAANPAVATLLAVEGEDLRRAVQAIYARMGMLADRIRSSPKEDRWLGARWMNLHHHWDLFRLSGTLLEKLHDRTLDDWGCVFAAIAKFEQVSEFDHKQLPAVVRCFAADFTHATPGSPSLERDVREVVNQLISGGRAAEIRYARALLQALEGAPPSPILTGEAWSDLAIRELAAMSDRRRAEWNELIQHSADSSSPRPSNAWRRKVRALLDSIRDDRFCDTISRWFALLDKPRTDELILATRQDTPSEYRIADDNQAVLKGLTWAASLVSDDRIPPLLSCLTLSAYRKVPGIGPRAVRVGNAAIYALGQIAGRSALGQLAMLRVKVKFGTGQKCLEAALNAAAQRENLPREEIEELGVPGYGLSEVGRRAEIFGDYRVEVVATGPSDVQTRVTRGVGTPSEKRLKSIPASLKSEQPEEVRELQAAAKEIATMLSAQRDRIDALFCEAKSWSLDTWRERYLDHPLVGVIARRLIWTVHGPTADPAPFPVTWLDEVASLVGPDGAPRKLPTNGLVRLWHPIDASESEVAAWRAFFEERQIRQPFKQAHREIYRLTDAERRTASYSNRYAAHILRQHQFNALCAVRGWKNKLRLMVDAEYPPATRQLSAHGLRAEFWIEGAGDQYGVDTNESGVFNFLSTDQVRFYRIAAPLTTAHAGGGGYEIHADRADADATPIALEQVSPVVLSEVMRDVDLFVGVTSLGNNPEWSDGGPEGRYRQYWHSYAWADLTESGKERERLLRRLIARLVVADRCTFEGNFLVVEGKLRKYKIHIGSGNILMKPDDQYLCIVPSAGQVAAGNAGVFLPFEGDRTLSIILSKALLLANDDKITDSTILSQIRRR